MAAIHWSKQLSNDFNNAGSWSTDTVPQAGDDAILDAPGASSYTVTNSISRTVNSIQTGSTALLDITAGRFTATKASGAGANRGEIKIEDGAAFRFAGVLDNIGDVVTWGSTKGADLVVAAGGASLTGGGFVELGNSLKSLVFGVTASTTLANVDNFISGGGQFGAGQLTFINETKGIVEALGTTPLILDTAGKTVTNNGLIEAGPGGLLYITATTVNDSGGGVLAANGGQVELRGADIIGGTLTSTGNWAIRPQSGLDILDGTTSAITNQGRVLLSDGRALTVEGVIDNVGQIIVNSLGLTTTLTIGAGGATLTGKGSVLLGANDANVVTGAAASSTLTNVDNVIHGAGQLGGGDLTIVNQAKGRIEASSSVALVIDTGGHQLTNSGLVRATGAGGLTISNTAVLNNGGLVLAAANSEVRFGSSAFEGGILRTTGNGYFATTNNAASLNGSIWALTNQAQLYIEDATSLSVSGTINNSATITAASTGGSTNLYVNGTATLTGAGSIVLGANLNNHVYGLGGPSTLTNVGNTISGEGTLGNGLLTLVNQAKGVIDANGGIGSLTIDTGANTIANAGLIEATGAGGLRILSDLTNSGVLEVGDGSFLTLQGTVKNTGSITLGSVGQTTDLVVGLPGLTLSGGGQVVLSADLDNRIYGATASATLTNVDNTISGAGQLGAGQLTLVNDAAGVIDATGGIATLTIDTGAGSVANAGLIESSGAGGMILKGSFDDQAGGNIYAVTGSSIALTSATVVGGHLTSNGSGFFHATDGGVVLNGGATSLTCDAVVQVDDAATVLLEGSIVNTGQIDLASAGSTTILRIAGNVTLSGGGNVVMGDNANNYIVGFSLSDFLFNVDNTISGGGQLGDGSLDLENGKNGVIDSNGSNGLIIDTGPLAVGNIVWNVGLIEETGSGELKINSDLANDGVLGAYSDVFLVKGEVSGSGSAIINGGILAFNTTFSQNVAFTGTAGELILGDSVHYGGAVSGFSLTGGTSFDLRDIGFVSSAEATYADNGFGTAGVLTVTDGTHTAHIDLVGNYAGSTFTASDDGVGGTMIVDPPKGSGQAPTHFVAAMAAFATPAGHSSHDTIAERRAVEPLLQMACRA